MVIFFEIWCLVSSISFQRSNIGWPQQPPTESTRIQHDILRLCIYLKKIQDIKNKAKFKKLDSSKVLSSDFFHALEALQPH